MRSTLWFIERLIERLSERLIVMVMPIVRFIARHPMLVLYVLSAQFFCVVVLVLLKPELQSNREFELVPPLSALIFFYGMFATFWIVDRRNELPLGGEQKQ